MKKINDTIKGVIRLIVAMLAFVNAILAAKGMSPLPIDEPTLTQALSDIAAGGLILYTAYKDMPLTKEGKRAHENMKTMKKVRKEYKRSIREDGYGVTLYDDADTDKDGAYMDDEGASYEGYENDEFMRELDKRLKKALNADGPEGGR